MLPENKRRRSNESTLKEIHPEYSLEGLTLKLKMQYIDHLMHRADSLEKDPDAEKDGRQKEKAEDEMAGWHIDPMGMTWSKLWEMVKDKEAWCAEVHGVTKT